SISHREVLVVALGYITQNVACSRLQVISQALRSYVEASSTACLSRSSGNLRLGYLAVPPAICFLHPVATLPEPPGLEVPQIGSMPVSALPTSAPALGGSIAPPPQRSIGFRSSSGTLRSMHNGTQREALGR